MPKSRGRPTATTTTVVLSRFFDSNVRLVAGVCSRCHLEQEDVKIVAVNRTFLEQKNLTIHNGRSIDDCRLKLPATTTTTTSSTSDNYALITRRASPPRLSTNYNGGGSEETASFCTMTDENRNNPESVSAFFKKEIQIKKEDPESPPSSLQKLNLGKLGKITKTEAKPLWIPPRSPHNLIEEALFHDPWSLLVATIFLNKTSCKCARPRVMEFLRDFSGPCEVLKKNPSDLEKYFLDLGLYKRRAEQVWRMSYDFVHKNWKNAKELYGIGKYGEDAYRMFVLGDLDIEPTDRFLRIYRDWARMKEKEEKTNQY